VQDIAALLLHAGRPELLATGLVEILTSAGCVSRVRAVARDETGAADTLAESDSRAQQPGGRPPRIFALGEARGRTIEVECQPRSDIESIATVSALAVLLEVIRDLERARLEREERLGLWPVEELPDEGDDAVIAGAMREVMRLARKVAPTTASVLITGESGTGKEIVARAIHRFSNRTDKPFVPFNCTAVPHDLLESHLFGYRRGAFTGAERDHPGLIRAAKDGTLFLDEVGELGLDLQPKLLRFLESGEVTPLGESEPIRVNARIVAATNANLDRLVQEGRFRMDLYYRLRVIPLPIPPLRERRDEIPDLARHFVRRAAADYDKGRPTIDDEMMELLVLFSWPGNVRQLGNELRRIVALADADATLTPDMLSPEILRARPAAAIVSGGEVTVPLDDTLNAALARVERHMVSAALKKHRGRMEVAARALGISRKGLYLKRQRFGL
jgi:transcriptional regulator with PAS, ATPase and Fis domain